jgi:cytochrome c peroxidase
MSREYKRALLILGLLMTGCEGKHQATEQVASALANDAVSTPQALPANLHPKINPRLLRRFKPLRESIESEDNPVTQAKTDLGRMLFYEQRLSKNQDLSCNSCHKLDRYGVDGERTSAGHRGQRGQRNAPTVYHAAGLFAQFWDGRADTVEEQAKGPIANPAEMAMVSGASAEKVLRSIPEYRVRFAAAFPREKQPVTFDNVGRAIGAFERRLVTPTRWDAYLRGDERALSDDEIRGLATFTNVGCMVCHTGEFLGGSMFEKAGVVEEWGNQNDQGRFAVSKRNADRMMFKVPSLRNVEMTAPYFHDGSGKTLDEAVQMMGRYQLGLSLTDDERGSIITWLRSLTGKLPMEYIREPQLPASTRETPAPDPA